MGKMDGCHFWGLVGLLAVAFVILYGIGTARVNKSYNIAVSVPPIPSHAASIQRGERPLACANVVMGRI